MNIVIGLGNPGEKYSKTRHNVGFMVLDHIAQREGLNWREEKKFKALIAEAGGTIYVKPQTFMNDSGITAQAILSYYNLLPKKLGILKQKDADLSNSLTVVHDEIDIKFGETKNSINRGPAGHNGIKSIINHLKTKNFKRIRIGVKGEKPAQMAVRDYVLGRFTKEELDHLSKTLIPQIEA